MAIQFPKRHVFTLAAAISALSISACGATTVTTTADKPATTEPTATMTLPDAPDTSTPIESVDVGSPTKSAPASTETAPETAFTESAHVGSSVTIEGSEASLRMRVKVLRVIDPVTAGEYDTASAGNRYVGVMVRLTNIGEDAYSDSPGNGATLIYGEDEQADSTIVSEGPCSSSFSSSVKLGSGASRQGCIPFEVPQANHIKTFQFTLDSGFADDTAEWSVR